MKLFAVTFMRATPLPASPPPPPPSPPVNVWVYDVRNIPASTLSEAAMAAPYPTPDSVLVEVRQVYPQLPTPGTAA